MEAEFHASAAVLERPGGPFVIGPVELAGPRADEVLVRIKAVGICHTDLVVASGAMGASFPVVLGHEGAGVVEAIGEAVTTVAVGDKVLLTFRSCGHCSRCETGHPAYCTDFFALNLSCTRADGAAAIHQHGAAVAGDFFGQSSFASHALAYERNVVKVAPDADLAALAPLGCGVQTGAGGVLRSLKVPSGSSLLVIGGGAVGLSAVLAGVVAGCSTIILLEPRAERRALALSLGAHHAIDPLADDAGAAIKAVEPAGLDFAFDTSGNLAAIMAAISVLKTRGVIGLVGVPAQIDAVLQLPLVPAILNGLTVMGITEGDSEPQEFIPELVALHASGRLPFDRFVTTYPFEDINAAMEDAHHGRCIKAVLLLDT